MPREQLTAKFTDDSVLELTPELVGPPIKRNTGSVGLPVDPSLEHLHDMRPSTLLFHLMQRLLGTRRRDLGAAPRRYLFEQLKRASMQWLDGCLACDDDTDRC